MEQSYDKSVIPRSKIKQLTFIYFPTKKKKISIICINKLPVQINYFKKNTGNLIRWKRYSVKTFTQKNDSRKKYILLDLHDPLCAFRMYRGYFTFQCGDVNESLSLREEFDIYTLADLATKDWQKYPCILNFCGGFLNFFFLCLKKIEKWNFALS